MTDAIMFRATWTIKPGKLDAAQKAAKEFVDAMNRALPGTRLVGSYLSADAKKIYVHEIHQNPDAVRAHLAGTVVPEFMPKFAALMDGPDFEVFGNVPTDIAKMIEAFHPKLHKGVHSYLR